MNIDDDTREFIFSFSQECYESYKSYMESLGDGRAVSLEEFQMEIFPNRTDMTEYLTATDSEKLETYKENFKEITEVFPFQDYRLIAESLGGHLDAECPGMVRFSKYSPAGQDFSLEIETKSDMSDFIENFNGSLDNYDPEEETMLWVDPITGHGKKGAPYHLRDVLGDMEACQSMSEDFIIKFQNILSLHEKSLESEIDKEKVGALFAQKANDLLQNDKCKYYDKNYAGLAKDAMNKTCAYEYGNPSELKSLLSDYLVDIGITDGKEETFEKGLKNVLFKLNQKNLSPKEANIVKMFDELFSSSGTNPEKYVEEVVLPAHDSALNNKSSFDWWKAAVSHAANSGGELWQDTYSRMRLFEKFGLIEKGLCDRDSEDPVFEKEFSKADKKYGEYMFDHLRLKNLLPEEKRLESVKKDNERKYRIEASKKSRTGYEELSR